jgi:hypothetical protein
MTRASTSAIRALEHRWGRFTVYGGSEVESRARSVATEVASTVSDLVPPDNVRALVLLGGYGRGEGGVEISTDGERLHNNFDVLLIHRAGGRLSPAQSERLRAGLDLVESRQQIGIDFAQQSDSYLQRAPAHVMWYDMRHGHKTLLGDPAFVPGLTRFGLESIPAGDVRNLLVNRAALLLLNDFIRQRSTDPRQTRRTLVKHTAKAIIGFGDALLFFHGRYHWSYRVKQERMRELSASPERFRELYDRAASFRLRPRYDDALLGDPDFWLDGLLGTLEPIHRSCEARRLGLTDLEWSDYPRAAVWRELTDDLLVPRRVAAKLINLVTGTSMRSASRGWPSPLAVRAVGLRGLLPVLLPASLYPEARVAFGRLAADVLGTATDETAELRDAFLGCWRDTFDPNLDLALKRLEIDPATLERSA